jgi:uncharacterized protein (TIGR02569 family)
MAPPDSVLAAFGAKAAASPVGGGQGRGFRAGDVFLKPVELTEEEASWTADVTSGLEQRGFQVASPIRGSNHRWVVDGWCAWEWFDGRHEAARWDEKLAACRDFHRALRGVPAPSFFGTRVDPWAIADRMCWGEIPISCSPETVVVVDRLMPFLEDCADESQVIHGDIAGNLLFGSDGPPCVIDFAPYFRPPAFAEGVMVVDAVTWEGAPASLLEVVSRPMVARGALRRVLEHDLHFRLRGYGSLEEVSAYRIVLEWLAG